MAAALVLGEWIGRYGLRIGIFVSIVMMLVMILLWDGMRVTAADEFLEKKGIKIWGRERYCLPFFCCLGVVLAVRAAVPTEFAAELERYLESTPAEERSQGVTGTLTGIIEDVEPEGEGIRLYVRDSLLSGGERELFQGEKWLAGGRTVITCAGVNFAADALEYLPGSRIQAEGWIYLFPEASNPGQFDTRNYYLGRNIQTGMKAESVCVIPEENPGLRAMLARELLWLEMKLYASLEQVCEDRYTGVFQALLLGSSRQVEEEIKELYQAGGIAHLLSVSGLHISSIAMVVYKGVRRYTGSFPAAMGIGGFFLLSYGIMVGSSASALRAVIMFCCFMGANVFGRKYDLLSGAGLAAILILLQYPMQIYQSGFWMSFLAAAGIGVVNPAVLAFTGCKNRVIQSILFSGAVQVSVLPVVLYSSYVCPVYSVLLNLLVIPCSAYLLFSAAGGAVGGLLVRGTGVFLAGTGHYILNWYEWLCTHVLELPGASVVTGKPMLWQVLLYYGMLLLLVCLMRGFENKEKLWGRFFAAGKEARSDELLSVEERRSRFGRKSLKLLSLCLGSCFLYALLLKWPDGELHITMLDVGQGECIHLQLPQGEHMLIDGGSTDVSSPGTYRIEPYLLSQGVKEIELLVLTHPDADHCNGIPELLEGGQIPVKQLYLADMYETDAWSEMLAWSEEKQIPVRYGQAGDEFVCSGVEFTCLHPKSRMQEENDNSTVLRLKYGGFSALFTGDISMEAEDFLEELEPVTLLKVPHHGSRYSASPELLSACIPKAAFISSGQGNLYGHPHPELLERLEAVGCQWYATKKSGALFLKTDGERAEIDTFAENIYFSSGNVYTIRD